MAYINKRSARGSARSFRNRRGGMSGLGGASDCGAGQVWCADFVFPGLPAGQCVTADQCNQWYKDHPAPQQASTSWTDVAGAAAGALTKIFGSQPQQQAPTIVQSGPSTGTILAIAGAGLVGVYLLTRK